MIVLIQETTKMVSTQNPYKLYDVLHRTNGKRRWFWYTESTLPKTARRFMESAIITSEYDFKHTLDEHVTVYQIRG